MMAKTKIVMLVTNKFDDFFEDDYWSKYSPPSALPSGTSQIKGSAYLHLPKANFSTEKAPHNLLEDLLVSELIQIVYPRSLSKYEYLPAWPIQ